MQRPFNMGNEWYTYKSNGKDKQEYVSYSEAWDIQEPLKPEPLYLDPKDLEDTDD